ncbi:hypothetical protein KHS38_04795 [Mucilaginibacter sp. Bleaf8]|uniref:Arm DNA-binding domain-containing protein n=1 Tax=Mucilaginibacter sp. Bleaf8 TaxID=2834430 RepID=UPI001BCC3F38|nr:Arm DNA-binding domain-containing protein [Mucilaginibacter sp. Bleaf8]MBS7563714.1 hypothetical protein [Mucilaginibacter sp. Bleaf8]
MEIFRKPTSEIWYLVAMVLSGAVQTISKAPRGIIQLLSSSISHVKTTARDVIDTDPIRGKFLFHFKSVPMKSNLHILFFLYRSKVNEKQQMPIFCGITIDGKRKQFSTGCFISATKWLPKLGAIKAPL